jgi:two-component system sensor histidine kinase DegS
MHSEGRSADGRAEDITRPHPSDIALGRAAGIDLQERERVRIAFDLHDGPAQTMSAALLQVRMLEDLDGDELRTGLAGLRSTLSIALEEVYELIESLGARGSNGDDLVSRVRSCVEGFAARSEIVPTLTIEGGVDSESPSLQIAVFRIVQEALSNVVRHSGAKRVDVRLSMSPEGVVCEVVDDGKGFTMSEPVESRRNRDPYGLHSMQERARMLNGECVIDSSPGKGTRVYVEIPAWRA